MVNRHLSEWQPNEGMIRSKNEQANNDRMNGWMKDESIKPNPFFLSLDLRSRVERNSWCRLCFTTFTELPLFPLIIFFPFHSSKHTLSLTAPYPARQMKRVYQVWTLASHSSSYIIHLPFIYSVIPQFSGLEHSAINPHPLFLARNSSISPHSVTAGKIISQ